MIGPEPVLLRTERCVLRPWRPDEAARLFDLRRRPEVAVWLADPRPWGDLQRAQQAVREWRNELDRTGLIGTWAVAVGQDLPVGSITLLPLPGSTEIHIGWYLHPDSQGRGLAREAAAAALAHTLAGGRDRVWAVMVPGNDPSAAVAAAIGMRDLGEVEDPWWGGQARVFQAGRAAPVPPVTT